MGNCLVKKLKGVVNNDNLPILGFNKYKVNLTSASLGATVRFTESSKIILLDGTWSDTGLREKIIPAKNTYYPSINTIVPDIPGAEFCTILIPSYTCYAYGYLTPVNGDKVEYPGLKYVSIESIDNFCILNLDDHLTIVSEVPNAILPFMRVFRCSNTTFNKPLDITGIGANGGLLSFNMGNSGRSNDVFGSLDSLGRNNATIEYLPDTKNVSLDLVNYVNNHRSSGRTTGSVDLPYLGSITVKANGTIIDVIKKQHNVLAWTADSITLDGNPIG